MKESAVEWLELNMDTLLMDGYKFNSEEAYNLYDKAKEMEKQQQGYSEEEVLELLVKMNEWPTTFNGEEEVEEWFEQSKNK